MDCSPLGSSVHVDSPGNNTEVGCHALLQGFLPNPGIKPRSPSLQADSLLSEPPGKPMRGLGVPISLCLPLAHDPASCPPHRARESRGEGV